MTKRRSTRSHGWLKVGILLASVTTTLAGAQWLQWQDTGVAAARANDIGRAVIHAAQPGADQSAPSAVQRPDGFSLELPPIPTVSAAPVRTVVRPVARARSSR